MIVVLTFCPCMYRIYYVQIEILIDFFPCIEKKQGRGSTRNLKLAKEFKGKRFPITWLNGRAVGEHARSLINECTKLVREEHNVPLKVKTWRDVPYEKKRKLFDNILVRSITYPNISITSYYIYAFISCLILLFIIFLGVFRS